MSLAGKDESKADSWMQLYTTLVHETSRLWMMWNPHLEDALCWTAQYLEGAIDMDTQLLEDWKTRHCRTMKDWDDVTEFTLSVAAT